MREELQNRRVELSEEKARRQLSRDELDEFTRLQEEFFSNPEADRRVAEEAAKLAEIENRLKAKYYDFMRSILGRTKLEDADNAEAP